MSDDVLHRTLALCEQYRKLVDETRAELLRERARNDVLTLVLATQPLRLPGTAEPIEGWLTVTEAARTARVSRELVYKWIRTGAVVPRRLHGGRIMLHIADIVPKTATSRPSRPTR